MLLHLPIVMASMFSPVAASETVPKFDNALQKLQNTWVQFSDADKKTCIASATIGNLASYVDLLICLELSRDDKTESDDTGRQQTTDAMRPPSAGVTVGIGHDPTTPGQMPSQGSR